MGIYAFAFVSIDFDAPLLQLWASEIYQHFSRRHKVVQELCQSQLQTYAQTCIPTPVKYLGEANIISLGICVLLWCPSIPPLLLV